MNVSRINEMNRPDRNQYTTQACMVSPAVRPTTLLKRQCVLLPPDAKDANAD